MGNGSVIQQVHAIKQGEIVQVHCESWTPSVDVHSSGKAIRTNSGYVPLGDLSGTP